MDSGDDKIIEDRRAEARRIFLVYLLDNDLRGAVGFRRCAEILDPDLGEELGELEHEPYRKRH